MTVADDLVGLYRTRLARLTAAAVLRLRAAWAVGFNPDDPVTTLTALGRAGAVLTRACQVAAETETRLWLTALLADAAGVGPADIDPVAFPDLAGSSAQGVPVGAVTGQAPAVYLARVGGGAGREDAARSAQAWLDNVAVSETYRVANHGTLATAGTDPRFSGRVIRITRPGPCQFCQLIHDRGYLPAHAGLAAHRNCRCTPNPEISSYATSRASVRRGIRAAQAAGGSETARTAEEREMVAARERARQHRARASGSGGGGRAGGDGGLPPASGPERVFLTEATAGWRRNDLPSGDLPSWPVTPPTYRDLESRNQIRNDWSAFRQDELPTATYLRDELNFPPIVSIDAMSGSHGPAPDAALPAFHVTFDIKRPRTANFSGVQSAMDRGRKQSHRVVIDERTDEYKLGMSEQDAVTALSEALQRTGGNFEEVLVLGDGWGILWP